MEDLVESNFWFGKRVLLTGHTGFKGAWLTLLLHRLGSEISGFSLPAEDKSLFSAAQLRELVDHMEGDIRDAKQLEAAVKSAKPEIVFHLAAQPIVKKSYEVPVETFETNVQGTVHLLEACRKQEGIKAIVCVTSDKCYENREWVWPYRESDPLGGYDPYSASKGAAEIAIASYRRSFFNSNVGLASVRAGNVIGGGDWAADRLIPDIARAILGGREVQIRSPYSIRPWQHVLDALNGYLMVAQKMVEGDTFAASAWNFGPSNNEARPVKWVVEKMISDWGEGSFRIAEDADHHEAHLLRLDTSKATSVLGWRPTWGLEAALASIIDWYRRTNHGEDPRLVTMEQLENHIAAQRTDTRTKEL
jgi:CDP-glucose 4,6-dehydratase